MKAPAYDLRRLDSLADVRHLFERFHGYGGVGNAFAHAFAVFEDEQPVAAYVWQPPPPGAARSVCPEAPQGVLSLSRMVAVPRDERRLRHVSRPLRRQMRVCLDRGRWPVLVTFSDEGQGHTGHVYKCSGWTPTTRKRRVYYVDADTGARASYYSNGKSRSRANVVKGGHTWLQRWEHRVCAEGEAAEWMRARGWRRVPIVGKRWASGRQAYAWVNERPAPS